MPSVQQQREKLISLLKQLFQLDQPDLDFGFYKIMHAKSEQVQRFLENDLLDIIKKEFGDLDGDRIAEAKAKYEQAIEQAKKFGAPNPEETDGVKEAKQAYDNAKEGGSPEGEIYDHLWRFFERYYDNGDFLSRRYYARETAGKAAPYAVPYDGREVYLHWANKDQYYIKTSEYLSNFTFNPTQSQEYKEQAGELLPKDEQGIDNLKVHCRIVEASEGEHGNIKNSEGQQRYFIIHEADPIKLENGELIIRFQYRQDPEKTGQDNTWKQKRLNEAVDTVMTALKKIPEAKTYLDVLSLPAPTEKQKDRPLLAKYLNQYTARNTMDYFIHKDLGGFLNRELDFYIKNEIMRLDDIEYADSPKVEDYLARIRVLRKIARHLIDFLAQLEEFQKKLWLKKKFVTETNYCITLDLIPEEFYPEIVGNERQREEWVKLFSIDEIQGDLATVAYSVPLSVEFLKANDKLVLDTKFFTEKFKYELVQSLDNLNDKVNGLLVHSDNFQALNILHKTYQNEIDCIYIDPPYNTDSSEILYKNGYKVSSWNSLINNSLVAAKKLLDDTGILCATIDDEQQKELSTILSASFGRENVLGTVCIRINPSGRITLRGFAQAHEYAIFLGKTNKSAISKLPRSAEQSQRFNQNDEKGVFEQRNFRREGSASERQSRPRRFFPIYVSGENIRIPKLEWQDASRSYLVLEDPKAGETVIYPIDSSGGERVWRWGIERINRELSEIFPKTNPKGELQLYYKYRPNEEGVLPTTVWTDKEYSATEYGTAVLKSLFGGRNEFTFPKSIHAVKDCIKIASPKSETALVLDYFAGSGTTGHAVININREIGGSSKYMLVEMGDYFDTVLKPRIAKVIYSENWKDGKPTTLDSGISQCFKYMRLETYEDALNNLSLGESSDRNKSIENNDALRRDYMLKYWLNMETQGSPSLLNIESFTNPTAYTVKVKKPGTDEYEDKNVDLIETFNWLIGLHVEHMDIWRSFDANFKREKDPELPEDGNTKLVIDGKLKEEDDGRFALRKIEGWVSRTPGNTQDREKVLVVWRKLSGNPEEDNAVLDEWFRKLDIRSRDSEFDVIYVNGSNNLPNLRRQDEHWKVRLLEETFHQKMWDIEDV